MGQQGSGKDNKNRENGATNQDVAIHLIDTMYNLVNSGNFVGVVVIFIVLITFILVWRLPPDSLGTHVGTILAVLVSGKYLYALLIGALGFSLWGNYVQRRIYKAEIRRLTHQRKKLMHGKGIKKLQPLSRHNPSEFDIDTGG